MIILQITFVHVYHLKYKMQAKPRYNRSSCIYIVTCRLTCIYTAMGIYIHHVHAYLHLHRRASYQDLPVHMHPHMKVACYTSMYEADRPHVFIRGPTPSSSDYIHPTPTLD